ncbi:MAG: hypothetical protein ACI9R3_006387 [Verrucomicrobiales bacterium]|jgi:hypothetical protein
MNNRFLQLIASALLASVANYGLADQIGNSDKTVPTTISANAETPDTGATQPVPPHEAEATEPLKSVSAIEKRLTEEHQKLVQSKQWASASAEDFIKELFAVLVEEFGKERYLEIAEAALLIFPDDASFIARIAAGYDPANAVSIARTLTKTFMLMHPSAEHPEAIASSIAKVVPFHRVALSGIASAAAKTSTVGASSDASATSSPARSSSVTTNPASEPVSVDPVTEPSTREPIERQFRIPAASAARFHTS